MPLRVLVTALSLLFGPMAAGQEGLFWVAIGSYGTADAAEQARATADAGWSAALRVAPAETSVGALYRVVAGPYEDRLSAVAALGDAQGAGFVDAWLVRDVLPGAPPPVAADWGYDGFDDLASDAELSGLYLGTDAAIGPLGLDDLDFDFSDLDLGEVPGLTAPIQRDPTIKPTEEPAFEAPDGYSLHKLDRGSRGR